MWIDACISFFCDKNKSCTVLTNKSVRDLKVDEKVKMTEGVTSNNSFLLLHH
jgi:hypothetical protein